MRWIKTPKCNESNIWLPEEVSKNVEDLNQNWIPDYIDDLTGWSISDQQKYAETALWKINIDNS